MKTIVQRIYSNSTYSRLLTWTKLIAITGSAQALVQVIGFFSGILIIRILPAQEYALYTLANTMLGTMLVLADGGISAGVLAQGGKVWQNRERLGSVLATGLYLRTRFAIGSFVIAVPILFYLLMLHGAGWIASVLIVVSLLPAFLTALTGRLLSVGPSLHQRVGPLQKVDICVSFIRFTLLLVILFAFPLSIVAILAASLPQIWANVRIRNISSVYANWKQDPDPIVQKEILIVVKRILPGSVYYCLSGQITTWLISVFGTTAAVAQIGALSRLAVLLNLLNATFTVLIIPRFARLENNQKLLFKRFMHISLGLVLLFSILILLVSVFSSQILGILGKNYLGLENELVLCIGGSCLSLFAGLIFTISTSRSWTINPFISIPITLAAFICAAIIIDISMLKGILKFNLFIASTELVMYFIYFFKKVKEVR